MGNVEHYPDLPNFPHLVHIGGEKNVEPGERLSVIQLLDILAGEMGKIQLLQMVGLRAQRRVEKVAFGEEIKEDPPRTDQTGPRDSGRQDGAVESTFRVSGAQKQGSGGTRRSAGAAGLGASSKIAGRAGLSQPATNGIRINTDHTDAHR
jgi:hypothetical protein